MRGKGHVKKFMPLYSRNSLMTPGQATEPGAKHDIQDTKTRWAREPKSKTAHSTPFFENVVVWAAEL
jgi:hypothetical protein